MTRFTSRSSTPSPRAQARGLALLALIAAPACSALGLADLDVPACDPLADPSPCEALNVDRGIDPHACRQYQCAEDTRRCALRPVDRDHDDEPDPALCAGQVSDALDCDDGDKLRNHRPGERCDLVDNDCDGRVDENLSMSPPQIAPLREAEPIRLTGAALVGPDALKLVLIADGETPQLLQVSMRERLMLSESQTLKASLFDDPATADSGACLRRDGAGEHGEDCEFGDVAAAASAPTLLAGVQRGGCRRGLLRTGILKQSGLTSQFQLGGPGRQTELEFGVEPNAAQCTMVDDTFVGATSPVIVAAPMAGASADDEALVVWRSVWTRQDGGACGRTECEQRRQPGCWSRLEAPDRCETAGLDDDCARESPILALPLKIHRDGAQSWIDRDPSTAVVSLGESRDSTAATVAAWSGGFLVAHGSEVGVRIHSLPLMAAASQTQPFSSRTVPTEAAADHVALALAPEDALGTVQAALAWREGCGDHARILFTRFELDRDGEPGAARDAISLQRDVQINDGPVLAHADRGFTQAPNEARPAGGWMVMWIERSHDEARLVMLRVAANGSVVDMPQTLATGELRFPTLQSLDSGGLRYTALKRDAGALSLVMGEPRCEPL